MMLALASLILMAGYLLWVYASKQQRLHKTVGTGISWVVMILAMVCLVCGICKYIKYKGEYGKYCPYSKHYQHHEEQKKIETK